MTDTKIMNIALIGGGAFCKEVLKKTTVDYDKWAGAARILYVVDPNPKALAISLAKKLKLKTFKDYHELYKPEYNVHLLIILRPEKEILDDILKTKPVTIRIIAYPVFELFWRGIAIEERKLRDRNIEIETILNGIQDFILVISPTRKIVEVNESFLKEMGFKRNDVIGKNCYEILKKTNRTCDQIACPLNEISLGKKHLHRVLKRLDSNGEERYIEVSIFPIWKKTGKLSKFIEISRDITKRKKEDDELTRRLEQMVEERTRQLKETHEQLLHQDKMASLGKLSASVVHELNNPIAGLLNFTLLIKRILKEGDFREEKSKLNQYLDIMETETRRIGRIVSNLLSFSRQSKMELKKVDITRLIERTLLVNSNIIKINGVKVESILSPTLPEIIGSEDQLQQVFMNIISNAVEAMETNNGNKLLRIKTEHSLSNDKVILSFNDNGISIPPENIQKIFEPFFTTKKKSKGVGLGLSVAYGIVQEHGGTIHIRSNKEEGTTFDIEIPVKPT
ncbi:MAG: PAS domain S-box protein [Desulfobacterales bacterium]|nr:PAS domain S-box protein [Desulfobacterales bacterium]MBF0397088.1 PAS domain S-box protein [Desulfobacterales bacterium]